MLTQSAIGGLRPSSPIGRQQHECLRIPLIVDVDTVPPLWCHLDTLPLDSPPLAEQADW